MFVLHTTAALALLLTQATPTDSEKPAEASAPSWTPSAPLLLVLVDRELCGAGVNGFDPEASRELVARVRRELLRAGQRMVEEGQINSILEREAVISKRYESTDANYVELLTGATQADTVVRVASRFTKEKTQQGRFVIELEVNLVVANTQDAEILVDQRVSGQGRSMEVREARKEALERAVEGRGDDSLIGLVLGALERQLAGDRQEGRQYSVRVHSAHEELSSEVLPPEVLDAVAASKPETKPSTPEMRHYTVRFKGSIGDLETALLMAAKKRRPDVLKKYGKHLEIETATTHRSLDLLLDLGDPPRPNLHDELERVLSKIAKKMYDQDASWYKGTQVRFVPASLPLDTQAGEHVKRFAQAYWHEYERLALKFPEKDPLLQEGSVTIDGHLYDSLRHARDVAQDLAGQYRASPAGQLAASIAAMTGSAFAEASGDSIKTVLDDESQYSVLYLIKSEVELFREEGAVDGGTVAFFQREGTQRGVFTRLALVLGSYKLSVTAVDMNGGAKQDYGLVLDDSLTDDLDKVFSGKR